MALTRTSTTSSVLDMTLNEETETKLRDAGEFVTQQKNGYEMARGYREDLIREAVAAGGTYREVAKAAGVTFQRVAQLITGAAAPGLRWDASLEIACPVCKVKPGEPCVDARGAHFHHERDDKRMAMWLAEHPELG